MSASLEYGRKVLLIELDALLDTRLGVAGGLSLEAWKQIAHSPEYKKRKTDDLSLFTNEFTKEEFFEAWDNRDERALEHSVLTNLGVELHGISDELFAAAIDKNNPEVKTVEFVINLFPYRLSDDAIKMLVQCVKDIVVTGCGIRTVSLPPQSLSLASLRANYTHYFLYNMQEWAEKAQDPMKIGAGAPQVSMRAPKLFTRDGIPTQGMIDEAFPTERKPAPEDMFNFMELLHSPVIDLKFFEIEFFSILTKPSK